MYETLFRKLDGWITPRGRPTLLSELTVSIQKFKVKTEPNPGSLVTPWFPITNTIPSPYNGSVLQEGSPSSGPPPHVSSSLPFTKPIVLQFQRRSVYWTLSHSPLLPQGWIGGHTTEEGWRYEDSFCRRRRISSVLVCVWLLLWVNLCRLRRNGP